MRILTNTLITRLLLCCSIAAVVSFPASADPTQPTPLSYIQNGSFTAHGKPSLANWSQLNPHALVVTGTEGSDVFAHAAASDISTISGLKQTIAIRPEWSRILLRGNIRVVFQTPGAAGPFVGVAMTWVDKTGHGTPVANAESWTYTTPGWVEVNQLLTIPAGTTALILSPEVSNAKADAYFKDLSITAWLSTFEDTFSGNAIDTSRWTPTVGPHNSGNGEQEWFSPSQVTVANNTLTITAEHKTTNGMQFASGEIRSIGKFQQRYGYYEFRLKCPFTNGSWCAAYLLGWNDDWPPEVDVEEMSGADGGVVLETNHYTDEYGRHRSSNVNFSPDGIDRTQYHTYAVIWEPGQMAWYFDGVYKGTTGQPYDDVSTVPMYIDINLATGSYGGDPTNSVWPQTFCCTKVSVCQRSDLPLPLYPGASQEITLPRNTAPLTALSCQPINSYGKTWRLVDGPAPVKIRDPHSISTIATFTKPGMYRFEIKIAKGVTTNTAQYLVYVNKAIGK